MGQVENSPVMVMVIHFDEIERVSAPNFYFFMTSHPVNTSESAFLHKGGH